jgi:hypothetical protein
VIDDGRAAWLRERHRAVGSGVRSARRIVIGVALRATLDRL